MGDWTEADRRLHLKVPRVTKESEDEMARLLSKGITMLLEGFIAHIKYSR
jgi:hypothetical protein